MHDNRASKLVFQQLDKHMTRLHRQSLDALMVYERQCFLNAQPYQRTAGCVHHANGVYRRRPCSRVVQLEFAVPRTRSGLLHPQSATTASAV